MGKTQASGERKLPDSRELRNQKPKVLVTAQRVVRTVSVFR